ncbi:MAG: pentapeptide repeat-containing protein [Proteobacteria bacterium]|nr:pentapeptide repeat-containing protein [Pseudomonadota bacterium]
MQLSKEIFLKLKESVSFFSSFTDGELLALLKLAVSEKYSDGDVVFKENSKGDEMYIILVGNVRITKYVGNKKEEVLTVLQPGACFGEMGVINQSPRSASAYIEGGDAILLVINESLLSQHNMLLAFKLYRNFAKMLAERLRETNEKFQAATMGDRHTHTQMKELLKKKLEKGQSLKGANLKGADLSGMFLNNADLKDTVFIESNLTETKCKQANFTNANFVNAKLNSITFERANFTGADFSAAKFERVDFRSCNMSGAKFIGAELSESYRWDEGGKPDTDAMPTGNTSDDTSRN